MNIRDALIEPVAYLPPAHTLDGLGAEDAERRIAGAAHSIAEIVGHLAFWQEWFLQRCEGADVPMAETAAEGWPTVQAGTWEDVRARFLAGLDRAVTLGQNAARVDAAITPAIPFPPLAESTVRDALIHVATHNAHHLGQVIVLRQLMHLWPPPAGSLTW